MKNKFRTMFEIKAGIVLTPEGDVVINNTWYRERRKKHFVPGKKAVCAIKKDLDKTIYGVSIVVSVVKVRAKAFKSAETRQMCRDFERLFWQAFDDLSHDQSLEDEAKLELYLDVWEDLLLEI